MRIRRGIAALLVSALLLAGVPGRAGAAFVTPEQAVETLAALGLFRGTETGYALEREVTREEAVTLLVRLLGGEQEALAQSGPMPFSDVSDWAQPYVAWGYAKSVVRGASPTALHARESATAREFLAFTLRALGYSEAAGDFTYENVLAFSDEIGLTHHEYGSGETFLREDAALVLYTALTLPLADGSEKLVERLLREGAFPREALLGTRLARYANSGRRQLDAAEIYERASSSVFLVESYESEQALERDEPSGTATGFFVSADGLALMSYHELEKMCAARVTTTDGRRYALERILYYDSYRDIAVARIERTSLDGQSLRAFPYLDLGDPAAIGPGERVYTMTCPVGLQDCISDGILSAVGQAADDPDYPFLQFTAPISQGSSGGALLNAYGEVIGVITGAFSGGNALNLAVPVDCLRAEMLTGEGQSLQEVYEIEQEKNANSTLTASETHLTLPVGETTEVIITRDCPGSVSIQYFCTDNNVLSCRWGRFTSKTTVPLYITALAPGSATLMISYSEGYGNPEAMVDVEVVVPGVG